MSVYSDPEPIRAIILSISEDMDEMNESAKESAAVTSRRTSSGSSDDSTYRMPMPLPRFLDT